MLRSDIRTESLVQLGDEGQVLYSTTKINNWINEWFIEIATRLGIDKTYATVTLVENEPNYNLGDHIFTDISEVYLTDISGIKSRIPVVTREELPMIFGAGWQSDNASNPSIAAQEDYNVLRIHQKPDANNAGKTLEIWGYADPTGLGSDSTTPILITALQASGAHYVAAKGYLSHGDLKKAEFHFGLFEKIYATHKSKQTKFSEDLMQWRQYGDGY